jgi:hypothetical protein
MRGYDAGAAARRATEGAKQGLINQWVDTRRMLRGMTRIALSVPSGFFLWKMGHVHVASEQPLWMVLSIAALVLMAMALPRFGLAGGRGPLWGLWLWFLSIGCLVGAFLAFSAVVNGVDLLNSPSAKSKIGWDGVVALFIGGLILVGGCDKLLKRCESHTGAGPRDRRSGRDAMFGG